MSTRQNRRTTVECQVKSMSLIVNTTRTSQRWHTLISCLIEACQRHYANQHCSSSARVAPSEWRADPKVDSSTIRFKRRTSCARLGYASLAQ
jgi:hypothetical protein